MSLVHGRSGTEITVQQLFVIRNLVTAAFCGIVHDQPSSLIVRSRGTRPTQRFAMLDSSISPPCRTRGSLCLSTWPGDVVSIDDAIIAGDTASPKDLTGQGWRSGISSISDAEPTLLHPLTFSNHTPSTVANSFKLGGIGQ